MSKLVRVIPTGDILRISDDYYERAKHQFELIEEKPVIEKPTLQNKALYICPKCKKEYKTEGPLNKHVLKCPA